MAARLKISGRHRGSLKRSCEDLEREGRLVRRGPRFRLPPPRSGVIEINPRGFGFVRPDDGGEDLYIPPNGLGNALPGDRVEVDLLPDLRGRSSRARVVGVRERNPLPVVGVTRREGSETRFVPDGGAFPRPVVLSEPRESGWKVTARIVADSESASLLRGEVVEVLGRAEDPAVDTIAVLRRLGVPDGPAAEAEAEAAACPSRLDPSVRAGRLDLTGLPLFTVDPEEARDFDDAVSLEEAPGGNVRLGVHVSDVSHYVRPGSELDREARERGTSVYLPARVVPMLPPRLSADLCSLLPGKDRLALSVFLTYTPEGELIESGFDSTVVRSRRRFTYAEVDRLLSGLDAPFRRREGPAAEVLDRMAGLARKLREKRFCRGALSLELPGEKIRFDSRGAIAAIELEGEDFSHALIEEFMLAANEAAAVWMSARGFAPVYRVHAEPDPRALRAFAASVRPLGFSIGNPGDREALRAFLARVRETPLSRVLQTAFLRSLRPAEYAAGNIGHYGLASACYAYVTSPIRRYPDLHNHRLIKAALGVAPAPPPEDVGALAERCTRTERRGAAAERDMIELRKLQYFRRRLDGAEEGSLRGVVAEVGKYGITVYLDDYLIAGFLPARNLGGGDYRLDRSGTALRDRRGGRAFRPGDEVPVRIAEVDLPNREVLFALDDWG